MAWGKGNIALYVAPTWRMSKELGWRPFLDRFGPWIIRKNETDMEATLSGGGVVRFRSADHRDSLRGSGLNGVVFDESEDIDERTWTEVIRPALSDRQGRAIFIGTPKPGGRLRKLWKNGGNEPDWKAFQFTTLQGGNVAASEIEAARHELDERTFRQEYEASFESTDGLVYYCFSRANVDSTIAPQPFKPIIWSLDFNIDPMISLLMQVQTWGDKYYGTYRETLEVFDEICLHNASARHACEEFERRTATMQKPVRCTVVGDASGGNRTHTTGESAWDVVREYFQGRSDYQMNFAYASRNTAVRARVDVVNAYLQNAAGERRAKISPKAKELIEDLESVAWARDRNERTTGEIDSRDWKRTHAADAFGYGVQYHGGGSRITALGGFLG